MRNFPETVSAKVSSRTKRLMESKKISGRSAIETGLKHLLSTEGFLKWQHEEIKAELRSARAEVIVLEMEMEEIQGKLEGLHSHGEDE